MPGQPMIDFHVHQVRAGSFGASEDFEKMLGLLVRATVGEANLVFPNPGDWGIDVLVGDLHGQVTVWQAKYFIRGVGKNQKPQIANSFESALRAASAHGYTVARWVLCIPSSMDGPAMQWWQGWSDGRERATGVAIELWDETRLCELLIQPAAAQVRRHYYNPYRLDGVDEESEGDGSAARAFAAVDAPESGPAWEGGAEYRLGSAEYVLHDGAVERPSRDRSWTWREATADRIEPGHCRVRLRQVQVRRPVVAAEECLSGLRAQAELLASLDGRAGLPRLIDVQVQGRCVTVVTAHPPGLPWAQVFGRGPVPLDRLTASAAVGAAGGVCAALGVVHERGCVHLRLHPDALFLDRDQRCFLRDVGLAAMPAPPDEGQVVYLAPEQARAFSTVDPRTDVYQLAAILYHTLTGHAPSPGASPPVKAVVPGFPEALDEMLLRSMERDIDRRPANVRVVRDAITRGRRALSQAGAR
jgi:hypothetical protein